MEPQTGAAHQIADAYIATLMASTSDAVIGTDAADLITLWNRGAEAMYDYRAEEMIGRHVSVLIPPELGSRESALWGRVRTGEAVVRPTQRVGRDGRRIDVLLSLSPVLDAAGQVIGMLGISRDITDQLRAEQSLRASEERFRTLFNHVPIGLNIADMEGRYVASNHVFEEMVGYSAAELHSVNFADITHPEDYERELPLYRAFHDGTRDSYTLIKRYIRKDGTEIKARLTVFWALPESGGNKYELAVVENLTEQLRAKAALAASEERFRATFEQAAVGMAHVSTAGVLVRVNDRLCSLLGYTRDELLGRPAACLHHPDDLPAIEAEVHRFDQRQISSVQLETRCLRRDGSVVWVRLTASVVREIEDEQFVAAIIEDITGRKRAEAALEHLAMHDALTGLPNRALLLDRMEQHLAAARRTVRPMALVMLDLNGFKEVNDTFGHVHGDTLLCAVGERMQAVLRAGDTLARLGGDEFALVLPDADAEVARRVTARVQHALEQAIDIEGQSVYVSAGAGVVIFPDHGEDSTALLRRADVAMYAAKRDRRDCVLYQPQLDRDAAEHLTLLGDLRVAIREHGLHLVYQPRVNLATGRIQSVEALARWYHPQRGLVPPEQFISMAEQAGLIRPLSAWALEEAVRQVCAWRAAGVEVDVSVNLSAQNLHDPELLPAVEGILARHHADPAWLTLEITESAIMVRPDQAMQMVRGLHRLGIRVSIDDFGTGYSSLLYLQRLPAHELKIDRSFVQHLMAEPGDATIVRAVIDLGHQLKLEVVAEGVEDEASAEYLRHLGCDYAQGYHFTPPLGAGDCLAMLRENAAAHMLGAAG